MSAESIPFASSQPAPGSGVTASKPCTWSLKHWGTTQYDLKLMCILAFLGCVLSVGWAGVLMPGWTPAEMISMGDQGSGDEAPMVENISPESIPATSDMETPQEPEEVTPPDAMETPPEPVVALMEDAVFTVPAPPEIVKPLTVAQPQPPDRPKPATPSKPQPRRTAGPPSPNPSPGSGPVSGAGTGMAGVPGAKPGKARTPQPTYPSYASAGRMSGTVVVSLVVDDAGNVVSCSLVRSCGFPQLDSHTCDYIRRSWHWPAGGRRTFTQNVQYRLR